MDLHQMTWIKRILHFLPQLKVRVVIRVLDLEREDGINNNDKYIIS